jgi:hypothetical protein
MKTVRCAIYTRKSSDEGLDQAFNSLDAQREACAAYILSQASEGWIALSDVYDDGGLSGGTLDRPALQRLLSEVKAGRIDTIVVYKVDRLTRSLMDFSKLVETFDAAGTSFVSVNCADNAPDTITLVSQIRLTRSGRAMRLVQDNGVPVTAALNLSLINLLVKARRWWKILREGEADIKTLAAREGVQDGYLTRVLRLAFLAPVVVDAILAGRQLPGATVTELTLGSGVQPNWVAQREQLISL